MKNKESILKKDLHLIRIEGESNNAKDRETMEDRYKRIEREKRSKFWI